MEGKRGEIAVDGFLQIVSWRRAPDGEYKDKRKSRLKSKGMVYMDGQRHRLA